MNYFERVTPLPYSNDVINSYVIFANGLQMILNGVIKNKLSTIRRKIDGILPDEYYQSEKLSSDEESQIMLVLNKFYERHPNHAQLEFVKLTIAPSQKEELWYSNLDQYFKEWRNIAEMRDRNEVN